MFKKTSFVVFVLLLTASLASAVPVIRFGDSVAPFGGNYYPTFTSTYDLYIWASNDIAYNPDASDPTVTGVDNIQIAIQFSDITKVNLQGGAISKFTAVSGNPFNTTTVSGKAYVGTDKVLGGLLNLDGVDQFGMTKIFKLTLDIKGFASVSFLNTGSPRETYIGNSTVGSKYLSSGSFSTPEPATLLLLGLGGVILRRKKSKGKM